MEINLNVYDFYLTQLVVIIMYTLHNFLAIFFLAPCVSAAFISTENSEEFETRNEIRENLVKYLKYFASVDATEEERAGLIEKGLLGTPDYFGFDVSSKPALVDVSFDCKVKKLAFEFAQKLVTSETVLKHVFDGLELGSMCSQIFPPLLKRHHRKNKKGKALEEGFNVFFIENSENSAYKVKNGRYGTIGNPFKSIHEGVTECMNKQQTEKCIILLRKGIHRLEKELLIKRNNIVIKSYNDENAVITSDKVIDVHWELHKKEFLNYEGLNPIFEGIEPKQSTKSVSFIGVFSSSLVCQKYCEDTPSCTSFAYFNNTCGSYSNMCYARNDGKWNPLKHTGVISGKKVHIH